MYRRVLFVVLVISTAVATRSMQSSPAKAATTITFWERAANATFTKPLVDQYNATHGTHVELTIIPDTEFVPKVGTAIAAGTAPDVIAIDLIYMPSFDAAGEMTDITSRVHQLSFYKKLSKSHIHLSTYHGKLYGVPYDADGSILFYNKTLFRRAGLDPNRPPKTWVDIEKDAKKITALGHGNYGYYFAGNCAGCNAFTFLPFIWAGKGDVLNKKGTRATMTSSGVKSAMAFYRRLWTEKQMPVGAKVDSGANFLSAFQTGKIGMEALGAFALGPVRDKHINFGVTFIPGMNGGTASFGGGDVIGIPRGSSHAAEAWSFIKWVLSPQQEVGYYAKNGRLPVRSDLARNRYSQSDKRLVLAAKALSIGRTPYTLKYNELFNDPNGPWGGAVHDAVFGNDLNQALRKAQQRFTQILGS